MPVDCVYGIISYFGNRFRLSYSQGQQGFCYLCLENLFVFFTFTWDLIRKFSRVSGLRTIFDTIFGLKKYNPGLRGSVGFEP